MTHSLRDFMGTMKKKGRPTGLVGEFLDLEDEGEQNFLSHQNQIQEKQEAVANPGNIGNNMEAFLSMAYNQERDKVSQQSASATGNMNFSEPQNATNTPDRILHFSDQNEKNRHPLPVDYDDNEETEEEEDEEMEDLETSSQSSTSTMEKIEDLEDDDKLEEQFCQPPSGEGVRYKNWFLTIFKDNFNPQQYLDRQTQYACWTKEVCPKTNRIHYHVYLELIEGKSMSAVKKYFQCLEMNCQTRKGTQEQAVMYVCKERTRFPNFKIGSFGTPKHQGRRSDLDWYCEAIFQGATKLELLKTGKGNVLRHLGMIDRAQRAVFGYDFMDTKIMENRTQEQTKNLQGTLQLCGVRIKSKRAKSGFKFPGDKEDVSDEEESAVNDPDREIRMLKTNTVYDDDLPEYLRGIPGRTQTDKVLNYFDSQLPKYQRPTTPAFISRVFTNIQGALDFFVKNDKVMIRHMGRTQARIQLLEEILLEFFYLSCKSPAEYKNNVPDSLMSSFESLAGKTIKEWEEKHKVPR